MQRTIELKYSPATDAQDLTDVLVQTEENPLIFTTDEDGKTFTALIPGFEDQPFIFQTRTSACLLRQCLGEKELEVILLEKGLYDARDTVLKIISDAEMGGSGFTSHPRKFSLDLIEIAPNTWTLRVMFGNGTHFRSLPREIDMERLKEKATA